MTTVYDVTTFPATGGVTAASDIGAVMNQIITEIKGNQDAPETRPGAVIYIPPGHYDLKTRVLIDISFLQIKGSGHGFLSRALKDIYAPTENTEDWDESQPGGSHVRVLNTDYPEAFIIARNNRGVFFNRLNSIEFRDFNIDGVSVTTATDPYIPGNGKIGIKVADETDGLRIEGMAMSYLSSAVRGVGIDNARFHHNYILECGEGFNFSGFVATPNFTDNVFFTTWTGNAIVLDGTGPLAGGCENAKIVGNSFLWAGAIRLKKVNRSVISGNTFRSGWPGMITLDYDCDEVLISGNNFFRDDSRYSDVTLTNRQNEKDDRYGLILVRGYGNTIVSNHFSFINIRSEMVLPEGSKATLILVQKGDGNFISNNNVLHNVDLRILLDGSTTNTKILWTMDAGEVIALPGATYTHVPVPPTVP